MKYVLTAAFLAFACFGFGQSSIPDGPTNEFTTVTDGGYDKLNARDAWLDSNKLRFYGTGTTTERDALSPASVGVFVNTTTATFDYWDGDSWESAQDGFEADTDTDEQTLSFDGSDLTISGGNTVDLSALGGGGGTDDQTAAEVSITDAGGYFTGTEVNTALQEIGSDLSANTGKLALIENSATADQTASEIETLLDAYFGDTDWRTQDGTGTDDQNAGEVAFTPNGSIAATNVQAAIEEVRDEAGVGGGDLSATDIDTLAEVTANRTEYYDAAVSAGATQTQAGATELADQFSFVTTAAANGDGIKFDDASNHTPGDRWYVRNDTSYTLSLYPATGDDLGEGDNTATTLYPDEAAIGLFLDDDTIEVEITRNVTYTATYSSGPILAKDIAKARVITIDTAGTYNLPAVADVPGGSCTVIVKGDISVVLNPDDADKIMLDGEDLADGDSVTNAGAAGDQFTFWDLGDGTGWGMQTNGATDTN